MHYITNNFSIQMLREPNCLVSFHELEYDEFKALSYNARSVVGNKDLAELLGVTHNKEIIKLNPDDVCFVAQAWGGKSENKTSKDDTELRFYCVKVIDNIKLEA